MPAYQRSLDGTWQGNVDPRDGAGQYRPLLPHERRGIRLIKHIPFSATVQRRGHWAAQDGCRRQRGATLVC
jgi:hypothetical protein